MAPAKQPPLLGKRIVVTRAPEQAAELVRELEHQGAEVLLLPTVTFAEPEDPAPLDEAIRLLSGFHWLLFTSQNAVRFFAHRCRLLGRLPGRTLGPHAGESSAAAPLIAAVGPVTAAAARREGLRVDYVATQYRGAALTQELGVQLTGRRVLLPRSDRARGDLPAALGAEGAVVVDVIAYRTCAPNSFDQRAIQAVIGGEVDVVSFLSPSAFHHLVEEVGLDTLHRITDHVALAAVGPVTAGAIRDMGLRVPIEPRQATAAALVAAITDYFAPHSPKGAKSL